MKYIVDYEFELDNFLIESDKKTYLSLFLDKPFEKSNLEKDRKSKYELDFLVLNHFQYELEIPNHLNVEFMTENVKFENSVMKYNVKYSMQNGKLSLDFSIENKKILLEPEDFEPWNDAIKNLKNIYNETIVLTQK